MNEQTQLKKTDERKKIHWTTYYIKNRQRKQENNETKHI